MFVCKLYLNKLYLNIARSDNKFMLFAWDMRERYTREGHLDAVRMVMFCF
jgi:hypothetical protein